MRDQSSDGVGLGVIVVFVCLFIAAKWFSNLIGVNLSTGSDVLARLVVSAVLAGIWIAWGNSDIKVDWPFYLTMLWIAFWPALDHWAKISGPVPDIFGDDFILPAQTFWWNAWYTTYGIALALLGLGVYQRARQHY